MHEREDLLGLDEAGESLSETMARLEDRSRAFGQALSGALRDGIGGAKSLEQVLAGLAGRFADIALSAGMKPLEQLLSRGFGALGGLLPGAGRVTPFADGGIVSRPSYFPLGNGLGLAGEAGPEAILPLRRGPDGSLGVAASGGPGAGPQIVFNVTTPDAESFARSEAQLSAMLARLSLSGQRNL